MTQIEQKTANAAAESHPDGGGVSRPSTFTPTDSHGLRGINPQDILQRVAEGELLRDIAKDYGVSRAAVSLYIARHVPKDVWQQVREHSIQARIEDAGKAFDCADDNITLARARESARLWMWRAEREFPHIYQAKPQTAVNINGTDGMQVQLVSYASHTAEQQLLEDEAHNRTIIATDTDEAEE